MNPAVILHTNLFCALSKDISADMFVNEPHLEVVSAHTHMDNQTHYKLWVV